MDVISWHFTLADTPSVLKMLERFRMLILEAAAVSGRLLIYKEGNLLKCGSDRGLFFFLEEVGNFSGKLCILNS